MAHDPGQSPAAAGDRVSSRDVPSRAFLAAQVEEAVRDLTAFGNPVVLALVAVLVQPELWLRVTVGLAAVEIVCRLIKIAAFRPRPRPVIYRSLIEKSDAASFPSIHTARTALTCSMLFFETADPLSLIILIALPLGVGLTRLALSKHRLLDIAGGLAIGIACAIALLFALPSWP